MQQLNLSVHAPTQPLAACRRHSYDLLARRGRSSCMGPPHSYTHAASNDGMYRLVHAPCSCVRMNTVGDAYVVGRSVGRHRLGEVVHDTILVMFS
jgi:hypothetical protein